MASDSRELIGHLKTSKLESLVNAFLNLICTFVLQNNLVKRDLYIIIIIILIIINCLS